MRLCLNPRYVPLLATTVVFLGLYTVGLVCFPGFRSWYVFLNLFGDNAFLGIAAVGATFVILSGGIDLSVGSVIAFTSMFLARALTPVAEGGWAWSAPVAIVLALLTGALLGAGMGGLIHMFRLPPFLVTLAGMFFARGLAFLVGSQSIEIRHEFFRTTVIEQLAIPVGELLEVRFVATCFVAVLAAGLVVAHCSRFGRNLYALGGSEQSAELMGLPVARTRIGVYAVAGLCSALAGLVYSFDLQKGDPAAGVGLELDAIAAVVIGGTLLSGGAGYLVGTLLGVLVYGLIKNLIDFHGNINSWWTSIIVGALLLLFLLLQKLVGALSPSRRATGIDAG